MADKFFTQKYCDRCHESLEKGRIMSMYNEDCICMDCKEKETKRSDYKEAQETEMAEVKKGNCNFKGIGLKKIDNGK